MYWRNLSEQTWLNFGERQRLDTYIRYSPPPDGGKMESSATCQYTYIASGPKFRATRKLISATQTDYKKLSEAAFNGTSFVSYDADAKMMTRQDKIPGSSGSELSQNPLIAPFLFLGPNSDNCPTCQLRFTDIVSPDFAKGLILPKGQRSNGLLHISMPGPPLGKKPTSWEIDIDEAGDSFTPKAITLTIDAGMEIVWRLLNYTNLGGYQFPTRIESTASVYPPTSPPTVMSTGTVTVISAGIPEQIADSVFNLDKEEKSAATDIDLDRNKSVKSPYDKLKANLRTQPNIYDESADGSKQISDALDLARKGRS